MHSQVKNKSLLSMFRNESKRSWKPQRNLSYRFPRGTTDGKRISCRTAKKTKNKNKNTKKQTQNPKKQWRRKLPSGFSWRITWGIGCPRFSVQNLSWALLSLLLFSSSEVGKRRLTQHSSPAAGGSAALSAQVVILKVSSGRIEKWQRNLLCTRHKIKRRWLR